MPWTNVDGTKSDGYATELGWFKWTRDVADQGDCAALFICKLSHGYKILVWAIGSDRHTDRNAHITMYWEGQFNFHIMHDPDDIRRHNDLEVTENMLLGVGLPTKWLCVKRDTLLEVLNRLSGYRDDLQTAISATTKKPVVNKVICPACKGTKVIDTGFYKRACMKCYEE